MEGDELATFPFNLGDLWDVGVKNVGREEECLLSVLLCWKATNTLTLENESANEWENEPKELKEEALEAAEPHLQTYIK